MVKYIPEHKITIFCLLLLLAVTNSLIFNLDETPLTGDADSYNSYAKNLALGHGYSLYDMGFSVYREPAYSFFLSLLYRIFGIENFNFVKIFQIFLIAGIAFFVYLSFLRCSYKNTGLLAAFLTALIPYYGYYTHILMSELFFGFFLALSFYLLIRILNKETNISLYLILGLALGIAVLTKSILIFFPLLVGVLIVYVTKDIRRVVYSLIIFSLCVGAWVGYVNKKTGHPAITDGRLDIHLYVRAARSTLSYKDQAYFLYSWIRKSALGGEYNDILNKYEQVSLIEQYANREKHGETVASIKKENVQKILRNLDGYLFGNTIEVAKLLFIEHLYPPVPQLLTRNTRAGFYLLLYSFFLFGIIRFMIYKKDCPKIIFLTAFFYLIYNWAALSFIDAFPRFNTPYLYFYIMIGVLGLADILDKKLNDQLNTKS